MPKRIQRKRVKGWRMPEGAIYVGRPTKWGNPYALDIYRTDYPEYADQPGEWRRMATSDFHGLVTGRWDRFDDIPDYPRDAITELRGRDLVCWCPLDQPCHADILLQLANEDVRPDGCCGACPAVVGGGYDCTCAGNPRCPGFEGTEDEEEDTWLD